MIEDLWTSENQELEAWRSAPLPDLILYLVDHHHLWTRMELARLETYAEEAVLLTGGATAPWPQLRDEISRFGRDCRAHMAMEEHILFPAILGQTAPDAPRSRGLAHPLARQLEAEHQAELALFLRLKELCPQSLPAGEVRDLAGRLQRSLRNLEKGLCRHVFMESHILFRRCLG